MKRCVCQVIVVVDADFYCVPLFLSTCIIYIGKIFTVVEGEIANACDAAANGQVFQSDAAGKGGIANTHNAVWNGYARQSGTVKKGLSTDAHDAVRNGEYTLDGRRTRQKL